MLDVKTELRDLEMSTRHITEGRQRIRRQIALVRELRADGHEVTMALQLLDALRGSVSAQREHRALIVKVLNDHSRLRLGVALAEGAFEPAPRRR